MKKASPLLLVAVFSLLLTSCIDSKYPLSDPQKSKPDERLVGVWRFRGDNGEVNYCHIGHVGEKLPASVMRVVNVQHMPDGKMHSGELLAFPTSLGDKTYLNAAEAKPSQFALLEEKGWTDEAINKYLIVRYQITGDVLTLQLIDQEAKKRAVEAGMIKGMSEKDQDGNIRVHFTDTTENFAKFVAEAGDTLFSKDGLRLERVK
ncbi:MAG: hypothetical protein ACYC4N_31105 [Pirellulaceae bacterium]